MPSTDILIRARFRPTELGWQAGPVMPHLRPIVSHVLLDVMLGITSCHTVQRFVTLKTHIVKGVKCTHP